MESHQVAPRPSRLTASSAADRARGGPAIAQIVPDLATFAVDDGFSYAIPAGMNVAVGSLVRIPLGGRTVRGYVVGTRDGATTRLKAIARVTGGPPVFDEALLATLRWLATHYVAPLAVLLAKTAPPNLPRTPKQPRWTVAVRSGSSPLSRVTGAAATGTHERPHYLLGRGGWASTIETLVASILEAERSAMVVMPTVAEAERLAQDLHPAFGNRVLTAFSAMEARERTAVWSLAASWPGHLLIGTREVALWPVTRLALTVVVEEGRRAMKERQTPTVHVRDALRRRAAIERHGLVLLGHVPTTEAVATGMPIERIGGTRVWPLVEIVDRNEEPPGAGIITSRSLRAIRTAVGGGKRVFVFTHRRGYAPAYRCTSCRLVRRCQTCESRAGRSNTCERCGAELGICIRCGNAQFEPLGAGAGRIAELLARTVETGGVGSSAPVWVGTERDLPGLTDVDLAVVVDADGLIHAPNYRAGEDALRTLARVASTLGSGRGRRAVIQTGLPSDPVIRALQHGDPLKYLEGELEQRAATQLPPAGEVIVLELSKAKTADANLRELVGTRAEVFGPAPYGERVRWLIQGRDLRGVRIGLRGLVQTWREAGIRVRVDVDPLEL